jgi:dTDP-4-dehydrorhamnose 3,5-epimerase-like enzyme
VGDLLVSGCRILDLPVVRDQRGNLTVIEATKHVPFEIRRIFYLYDIPAGEHRAGHAHKTLAQVLVALAGSFDVIIDDGRQQQTVTLNRPFIGLYLPHLVWRDIQNFSAGSVCLALASDHYDEADYIRDYEQFVIARAAR